MKQTHQQSKLFTLILTIRNSVTNDFYSFISSLILTDDTPIDDDGLFKMEHIFYSTHHYDRCRDLCMKDPVHTVVLLKYLESQVNVEFDLQFMKKKKFRSYKRHMYFQLFQAKLALGNDRFTVLISTLDESILRNLAEYNINLTV